MNNIDADVVAGFGDEWSRMDQAELQGDEYRRLFESYFGIFPFETLAPDAVGFDLGCGSGRWARGVAPRVGYLHCVDASQAALDVARRNLEGQSNTDFHRASVDAIPLAPSTMDFGYCLGVLHHVPDTEAGLRHAVSRLKPGAPFLLYLYYAFDNRPAWFKGIWRASEALRYAISRMPHSARYWISQALALTVYWPLARLALVLERMGAPIASFPLSAYRRTSLYTMRTDALDRFGTRLEQRFTRADMQAMMERSGLGQIRFSDRSPFWCAVGRRAST